MRADLLKEVLALRREAWKAAGETSDLGLCGTAMREHQSFRLLASASRDPLVGLRMVKRLRSRWKHRSSFDTRRSSDSKTLLIDGVAKARPAVLSYVESMLGEEVGHFISRDDLPGRLDFVPNSWPFAFWRFALWTAISCLWSSKRFHKAIGIFSVAEITVLLEYIDRQQVDHVVDFAPYLLDSNLLYLLLKKRNIRMTKVPSAGPMSTHNHILLSDEVVISTPYHNFEIGQFKQTFRVEKTLKWIPERTQNYIDRYRTNRPATQLGTIGYYSHGSWVRAAAGHTSDGLGLHGKEDELLRHIGVILSKHPEWKLLIFPHPREKKAEVLDQTQAYYKECLGAVPFEISTDSTPTALQFERAEIGLAVFSTIIYERLFSGYKTFIFHAAADSFPHPETSLHNIALKGEDEIEHALNQWMAADEEGYFTKNDLQGYRWTSYDSLPAFLPFKQQL